MSNRFGSFNHEYTITTTIEGRGFRTVLETTLSCKIEIWPREDGKPEHEVELWAVELETGKKLDVNKYPFPVELREAIYLDFLSVRE